MIVLILLFNVLIASTFTFSKAALSYLSPFALVTLRFLISGFCLMGYHLWYTKQIYAPRGLKEWRLFLLIILVPFYGALVSDNWSLQFISSSKSCLIYNLTPLLSAFIAYIGFGQTITVRQCIALFFGFCSLFPILASDSQNTLSIDTFTYFSLPEVVLLCSVALGAWGWLLMQRLIVEKQYSSLFVNGVGLLGAGVISGIQWMVLGVLFPHMLQVDYSGQSTDTVLQMVQQYIDPLKAQWIVGSGYVGWLVCACHVVGYPLYGYLLNTYSATFLAFAGATIPLIAAVLGVFFLGEPIPHGFFSTFLFMSASLILFYTEERKKRVHQ